MSLTQHSTKTFDAIEEAWSRAQLAPRLIRFFRADDPFDGTEEFSLSSYPLWSIGRADRSRPCTSPGPRIWSCEDGLMSSRHATIAAKGRQLEIVDDGSKNGTFVNGERLSAPRILCDGDVVECGHSFFIYRDESEVIPTRPCVPRGPAVLDTPPLYYQVAPLFPYVDSDVSLHLQGETGTGKEVVAKAIHDLSGRSGPFVARNCAAIPDNLFESELFGYVKGAFSGASGTQRGQILAADGGTLFLDEIGELSMAMQAKLLRVLELKEVLPLGATTPIPVDFRLISATLQDVKARVADGQFRADLYGRLGHTFLVPALREHREEIGRLVGMFLLSRLADGPKPAPKVYFTLGAARALVTHAWPYNVRELRQCIDSAFMAAVSEMDDDGFCAIKQRHLPFASSARCAPARGPLASTFELQEVTDASILSALRTAGGNRSEAARLLGISERTVFRRLRKLRQASSG